MFSKKLIFTVLFIFCLLITTSSYAGTQWKPYQFQKDERYEFKIVLDMTESEEAPGKEVIYVLEIKSVPEKEGFVELNFTTKSLIGEEELTYEKVFNLGEIIGVPLAFLIVNPMYSYIFEQVEFDVGEKIKILGLGTIKVVKKETVGGREGFVCQLFQVEGNKEELLIEWTIDPTLALPLRAKNFKDGELESFFELISYNKE
ncbi:MAG: hypothetical protein N2380_09640 [bacterium]|nr:hypothetical protein [bacterium]